MDVRDCTIVVMKTLATVGLIICGVGITLTVYSGMWKSFTLWVLLGSACLFINGVRLKGGGAN